MMKSPNTRKYCVFTCDNKNSLMQVSKVIETNLDNVGCFDDFKAGQMKYIIF